MGATIFSKIGQGEAHDNTVREFCWVQDDDPGLVQMLARRARQSTWPTRIFTVYARRAPTVLNRQRLQAAAGERERQSCVGDLRGADRKRSPDARAGSRSCIIGVAGNMASGRQSVEWALGNGRRFAPVGLGFRLCGPVMTKAQSDRLERRLRRHCGPVSPTGAQTAPGLVEEFD